MSSTQEVREAVHAFIDEYLDEVDVRNEGPVVAMADADELHMLEEAPIPQEGRPLRDAMEELRRDVYDRSTKLNHSRYLGFVPGPATLESWAGDVMTNAYNIHAASWMSSSAASAIERKLIRFLGECAGYNPATSGGIFVSGGSMANLTAVIAARENRLPREEIARGCAYLSRETHSSLRKALMVAGISEGNIRLVDTNADGSISLADLDRLLEADRARGLRPFLLVGNAGTTNTGAIDDFRQMALRARRYGLWLHVDGAYGASVLLSASHRNLLAGIGEADSIAWDAHKWLFQTYDCSMLLVKDADVLIHTYHAHPDYLRDLETARAEINYMDYGIELTRPARALKLWLTIQTKGLTALGRDIDRGIELAEYFQGELERRDGWSIVAPARLATLCFRFAPANKTPEETDALNDRISARMLEENYAGIFTTLIGDRTVLRVCTINPTTTREEVDTIVEHLDRAARALD